MSEMLSDRLRNEVERLRAENVRLLKALAELVLCKDIKDRIEAIHVIGPRYHALVAEYEYRKPGAWEQARAALAAREGA